MPSSLWRQGFLTPLFLSAALISPASALAQWTPVIVDDAVITYVDNIPSHRTALVKMAWLADYRVVQVLEESGYFSRIEQGEYDCRNKRSRLLYVVLRSGAMGEGHTVYSDYRRRAWKKIMPQSFGETLWQIACLAK